MQAAKMISHKVALSDATTEKVDIDRAVPHYRAEAGAAVEDRAGARGWPVAYRRRDGLVSRETVRTRQSRLVTLPEGPVGLSTAGAPRMITAVQVELVIIKTETLPDRRLQGIRSGGRRA